MNYEISDNTAIVLLICLTLFIILYLIYYYFFENRPDQIRM